MYSKVYFILSVLFLFSHHLSAQQKNFCPDANHPHAIDLGIGVKWACCNVGSRKPEDFGSYFAWGETVTKTRFSQNNYRYKKQGMISCVDLGDDISGTRYDVARAKMGGTWRMPDMDGINALISLCASEWVEYNGVWGGKFTGPNGNVIFLPGAGCKFDPEIEDLDDSYPFASYWTSIPSQGVSFGAYSLYFGDGFGDLEQMGRYGGHSVRAVKK